VSLLQPTSSSEIPNRTIGPPPSIKLDDSDKWRSIRFLTAESTIVTRVRLLYLVEWKGFDNTLMQQVGNHPKTLPMHPK